jgi:DNA-binding Lrp family transcriptional regulator
MPKALIRICVNVGKERKIRDTLRRLKEVKMAEITAGEQDVIAIVEGKSFEAILKTVTAKIRKNDGIKITWTNFILE